MAVIGIDDDAIMFSALVFDDVIAAMARRDVPNALRELENVMRDIGVIGAAGFADDVARHYRRAA